MANAQKSAAAKAAPKAARQAAPPQPADEATEIARPPRRRPSKKRLIGLGAAALLSLGLAGAFHAELFAELEAQLAPSPDTTAEGAAAPPKPVKKAQAFVPIDQFTVNLFDDERERYLQLGLIAEVSETAAAEAIKQKMPVIRSSILLSLSAKRSRDIAGPDGKRLLADELLQLVRAPLAGEPHSQAVERVHFSAFIIQ